MTKISLFTPINYAIPCSCAQGALSILSNYFYLGGTRATVVKGDEVRLENGKVSKSTIALKVASYVLLFPLTLTLLAINVGLRYQHNFTIISSSQTKKGPSQESNLLALPKDHSAAFTSTEKLLEDNSQEVVTQDVNKNSSPIISNEKTQVIFSSSPNQKGDREPILEVHQEESKQISHSNTTVAAQNVENVRQQVLTSPSKENSFQPSEKKPQAISSLDVNKNSSPIISNEKTQVIFPSSPNQKDDRKRVLKVHQEESKQISHSNTTVAAQNVENVRQKVLTSPSLKKNSFQRSEKTLPAISSLDKMPVKNSAEISPHNKKAEPLSLEKFKEKLKFFNDKDLHQIAADLFKIAPKTLKLTEILNLIFQECGVYDILSLLDAILKAHPSLTLSPYDKIRRAILEDKQHVLNNSSLIAMLKEHALDKDEEKITGCCDLAYRLNHPYIYRLSRTSILPSDYSLNFLWVNLNPQDRIKDTAQNIFRDGLDHSENADCIKDPKALRTFEKNEKSLEKEDLENWNKIKKSFAYRISRWADVNQNAQINLWYDSALVTQKAQQKTFEVMKNISESRGVNLKLKDIRQLPNIGGEIGHSLHPGTQVYYRVDLLKALIADHMISSPKESAKYCVVSDIDVELMTPQQMFDQRTVDYLSSNGYVFNRVGLSGNFENSFFIFNKENKNLQKIHDETIIKRTATYIKALRQYPKGTILRPDYILDSQFVFKQYYHFRRNMKELDDELADSRKVVKCPKSQFNFGGNFSKSEYQAETFRFIGDSNIPYTINGRNFNKSDEEGKIKEFINWKAEPLPLV